jgi:2'-hydroxyisoflavone reductase
VKLLVLGGTLFLGRHIVVAALARGHEVTLFNRGETNPELFSELERLRGDRATGDYAALRGRSWDAAIDVHGRAPTPVRSAAETLAHAVDRYAFVSSISVYADFSRPVEEGAATRKLAPDADEYDLENYGAAKAECERIVGRLFGDRALVVRPGLIVGPHDPTDRFTWWPRRIARGGDVLAPGDPGRLVQVIDGRDLAAWLVEMVDLGAGGTYNATGPDYPLTMGRMLDDCKRAAPSDARLVWVSDEFLTGQGVGEWMELPLWLAGPEWAGMLAADVSRALDAGLAFRPLTETIRDTLDWDATRADADRATNVGLAPEREAELLELWAARA